MKRLLIFFIIIISYNQISLAPVHHEDLPSKKQDVDPEVSAKLAEFKNKQPHEILGVPVDASKDQIETAFKALVEKWHPDRNEKFEPVFEIIKTAYTKLKNEIALKQVDERKYHAYGKVRDERALSADQLNFLNKIKLLVDQLPKTDKEIFASYLYYILERRVQNNPQIELDVLPVYSQIINEKVQNKQIYYKIIETMNSLSNQSKIADTKLYLELYKDAFPGEKNLIIFGKDQGETFINPSSYKI